VDDVDVWCEARLEDLDGEFAICSFEGDLLPRSTYRAQDVRVPPLPGASAEPARFATGDLVEMRVPASKSSPGSWCPASVCSAGPGVCIVDVGDRWSGDGRSSRVVMQSDLRPIRENRSSVAELVTRAAIAVDEALADWLQGQAATQCFAQVEQLTLGINGAAQRGPGWCVDHAPLLSIRFDDQSHSIVLLGTDEALKRARVYTAALVQNHLHIALCQRAVGLREQAWQAKAEASRDSKAPGGAGEGETSRRLKTRGGCRRGDKASHLRRASESEAASMLLAENDVYQAVIWYETAFVAQLIGKGGHRVRLRQAKFGVTFNIRPGPPSNPYLSQVTITGPVPEDVQRAIDDIEIVSDFLDDGGQALDWAVGVAGDRGSRGWRLRMIDGLFSCARDPANRHRLLFRGTREGCAVAKEQLSASLQRQGALSHRTAHEGQYSDGEVVNGYADT